MPLPLGFNLLAAIHLLFGGIGMVRFLRAEGAGMTASLIAGIGMVGLPKIWSHLAAGHLTLIYAVCWTPWLLLAQNSALRGSAKSRFTAWPAIIFALLILADVRWAAYAGLLWLGYTVWMRNTLSIEEDRIRPARKIDWSKTSALLLKITLGILVQVGLAALIAAPLLLPLVEYTGLSTRSELAPGDVFHYSLPPGNLLGLFFPDPSGFAEFVFYPTAGILVLALWAISRRSSRQRSAYWIWAGAAALLFSLGSAIPLLEILARLPGFDLLRVPPRALFIVDMCLLILAAWGFQDLLTHSDDPRPEIGRFPRLVLLGMAEITILLAVAVSLAERKVSFSFTWGAAWTSIVVVLALLWMGQRLSSRYAAGIIITAVLLDGLVVNALGVEGRSPVDVLAEGRPAIEYIQEQPGLFRVYSPSYSFPQQTSVSYRMHSAEGVDPLQLKAYSAFMEKATGVPSPGYSVTLPPFTGGDPKTDNQMCKPDPTRLGWLNVRYIAAEYDLDVPGLDLQNQYGTTRLYINTRSMPYAWTQEQADRIEGPVRAAAVILKTPNRILLDAEGPGVMVLSEIMYPGWEARLEGKPAEIFPVAGILRGVRLEQDKQQVEFVFHPRLVYIGLGFSLVTLFALAFVSRRKGGVHR
jgi:hypothetical protein